ncbi:MAG TPA: amylo-alpha-1,6-glucosidase [Bryobacteraceae bacterium]|nr:amylo-alpha-1,6-glucosidase [Bryobacteraceae bacterium]
MSESDYLYPKEGPRAEDPHWSEEWLVTNGLGGYASGTVTGLNTRGYHGYLIAALAAPRGRMVMLNEVYEHVELGDGNLVPLNTGKNFDDERDPHFDIEFRLEMGLPVWIYKAKDLTIERRVWMPNLQNTVYLDYRMNSGERKLRLRLSPALNMRSLEDPVSMPIAAPYSLIVTDDRYEIVTSPDLPALHLRVKGAGGSFSIARRRLEKISYSTEANRGYPAVGELWSPGSFSADIEPGRNMTLVASTEPWEAINALTVERALDAEYTRRRRLRLAADARAAGSFGQQLVLAADQFVVTPAGRVEDATRAKAEGDDIKTVIAGYHWFTDWGRDTMISLEGLTLTTGRKLEAGYILRTFAHAIRDGLIPNLFPEGSRSGLYHTADGTLWFFHALDRYLEATEDRNTLATIMPNLLDVMRHHIEGTRFGIGVDNEDGLLRQGQEGFQLTWMDAKVGDWVVTPRRGKAVEINALWYNALRLLAGWCSELNAHEQCRQFAVLADRAKESFNRRFWYHDGGYLYDVIDGEEQERDTSFRPNQLFAISLKHPVLEKQYWEPVVSKVKQRLLTPVGLRSLAPGSKDYRAQYGGDLRSRDAAYHQGTVWAWLIGPFIDAWLKVYPGDHAAANGFLDGFKDHLGQACIGSISEIFDAQPPYTPRGCVAQAWSVAEVLRCLVKTTRV